MAEDLKALTADIVTAHASNNTVAIEELPILISSVYKALSSIGSSAEPEQPAQAPAVPVRLSIKPDYIVSLESGKKMKMLKRYLMTNYGMTPDAYRVKWDLPRDYPMVAPNYAQTRRDLALKIGLGRGATGRKAAAPKTANSASTRATKVAPKKRAAKSKASAKPA